MKTSNIFVTVDAVIFKEAGNDCHILLIQRKNDPFKGMWALPGGFVDEHEDLEEAAKRELQEETGLNIKQLSQLGAYGKPYRDPRHHTVSVAYTGFAEADAEIKGADDAEDARWFSIIRLPELAFDHADIISDAIKKLKLQ